MNQTDPHQRSSPPRTPLPLIPRGRHRPLIHRRRQAEVSGWRVACSPGGRTLIQTAAERLSSQSALSTMSPSAPSVTKRNQNQGYACTNRDITAFLNVEL